MFGQQETLVHIQKMNEEIRGWMELPPEVKISEVLKLFKELELHYEEIQKNIDKRYILRSESIQLGESFSPAKLKDMQDASKTIIERVIDFNKIEVNTHFFLKLYLLKNNFDNFNYVFNNFHQYDDCISSIRKAHNQMDFGYEMTLYKIQTNKVEIIDVEDPINI